ncbi:MAG: DUF1080 domain-containing protein [Verrucomicrobia bacterium]|nr:DUF1080 domain-containing protein [Verrucomicrobiota bacterium]
MNVTLVSGQTVGAGRYILNKQLGDNTMAWLAHDEIENKPVVLKFLPAELYQDPRGLEELRTQVGIAQDLSHPNVANIYELYEATGEDPFICLEYIEGMNLASLQTMQPNKVFNWTFLAPLLKQIFAALQFVHENRLVQGAIRPSSLMLDRSGQVKLLDVGIAGTLNNPLYGGPPTTGAGGLLRYLSPQQVDGGQPQTTDDIYSLGTTVYEFLTSTPPFHSGDILPQIRGTKPPTIEDRLAHLKISNRVPPIVSSIVMSCLSKEASARPQDVDTIARSLEFAEMSEPEPVRMIPARTAPAPQANVEYVDRETDIVVPSKWQGQSVASRGQSAPRKKSSIGILAVVAAVVVIGGAGAFFFVSRDSAPTDPAAIGESSSRTAENSALVETVPDGTPAIPIDTEKETADEIKTRRAAIEAAEIARLAARSDSGFQDIFNGRDLTGWTGESDVWSVRDGAITATLNADAKRVSSLVWDGGPLSDFELRVVFRFDPDEGAHRQSTVAVTYRGRKYNQFELRGYQYRMTRDGNNTGMLTSRDRLGMISYTQKTVVELFNSNDRIRKIADLEPLPVILAAIKKNDWNEAVIIAQGDQFVHKINGKVVADMTDSNEKRLAKSGLLALELMIDYKPYTVHFKDIRLKRLSK